MPLTSSQLKFFADYIRQQLGIIYSADNYFQLEKRLVDVSKSLSLSGPEALYEQAQGGIHGVFKQVLLDIATNNETSFFRDPKIFQAIEKHIIPGIRALHPTLSVMRIWCAASSYGQEPYSLAMLLSEMKAKDPSLPRFEIVATDISEAVLARAKEGRYSQLEVQRGLPALLLVKYFTKTPDDYWLLKPEIRVAVQFRKQNLLESFGSLGAFEVVLCRNVLIYQKDDRKKEIIANIGRAITPKGYFVMGAAESLFGLSDAFTQVAQDGAIFFQKKAA